jgi:hypothetical protein
MELRFGSGGEVGLRMRMRMPCARDVGVGLVAMGVDLGLEDGQGLELLVDLHEEWRGVGKVAGVKVNGRESESTKIPARVLVHVQAQAQVEVLAQLRVKILAQLRVQMQAWPQARP